MILNLTPEQLAALPDDPGGLLAISPDLLDQKNRVAMPHPVWYHITDVASLRALIDQRDKWWEEASNACNRVAQERDVLRKRVEDLERRIEELESCKNKISS